MPVRRHRTLAEAEAALWREPDGPDLARAIRALWSLSARLCPRRFPPGLYRHRSIEEANRLRDGWEEAAVRAASGGRAEPGP